MSKENLRVYYASKVPVKKFTYFNVKTIKEAICVLQTLVKRDLDDKNITDNVMGLAEYDPVDKEWTEWYTDEGEDIMSLVSL